MTIVLDAIAALNIASGALALVAPFGGLALALYDMRREPARPYSVKRA